MSFNLSNPVTLAAIAGAAGFFFTRAKSRKMRNAALLGGAAFLFGPPIVARLPIRTA